jgi:hypothetical protein
LIATRLAASGKNYFFSEQYSSLNRLEYYSFTDSVALSANSMLFIIANNRLRLRDFSSPKRPACRGAIHPASLLMAFMDNFIEASYKSFQDGSQQF